MPNFGTEGNMVLWAAVQHQGHSFLAEDGKKGELSSHYTGLVIIYIYIYIMI